jgi:Receptor family ligand binding region.
MQESKTVGLWREKYANLCRKTNVNQSDYAGYAYDAVWTYAYALNSLQRENESFLSDIHSNGTTERLVSLLQATDFHGVSGRIRFLGASRVSDINVIQWINKTAKTVGTFYPNVSTEKMEIVGGT